MRLSAVMPFSSTSIIIIIIPYVDVAVLESEMKPRDPATGDVDYGWSLQSGSIFLDDSA